MLSPKNIGWSTVLANYKRYSNFGSDLPEHSWRMRIKDAREVETGWDDMILVTIVIVGVCGWLLVLKKSFVPEHSQYIFTWHDKSWSFNNHKLCHYVYLFVTTLITFNYNFNYTVRLFEWIFVRSVHLFKNF